MRNNGFRESRFRCVCGWEFAHRPRRDRQSRYYYRRNSSNNSTTIRTATGKVLVLLERVFSPWKKKKSARFEFRRGRSSIRNPRNERLSIASPTGLANVMLVQSEYSIDRYASNLQLVNMSRANLNATGFVTRDESMYGNRRFSNLLQEIRAKLSRVDRFPSSLFSSSSRISSCRLGGA